MDYTTSWKDPRKMTEQELRNDFFGLASVKPEGWTVDLLTDTAYSPHDWAIKRIKDQPFF